VWRALVAPIATIITTASLATGIGDATPVVDASARLTIDANTGSLTSTLVPSDATLECDGGSRGTGFVRNVATPACALVRRGTVGKIARRHREARLCTDVYGGPQRARIHGTIDGRPVDMVITRNDGCGISDWDQLRPLLGDPERTGAIPRHSPRAVVTTVAPPATYRVQRGDTLTEIAKQFHTSVAAIVAANQLSDADALTEGQELTLPPPSAVRIDAELVGGRTDSGFDLTLVGATPSEVVTFVITLPDGSTYTGAPHVASGYGVVTTTYSAEIGPGTYVVTATGERGSNAEARFHVDPPDRPRNRASAAP
jgi:LysM repeat protein